MLGIMSPYVPDWFRHVYRSLGRAMVRRAYRELSLVETFSKIYQSRAWGPDEFYSGSGSELTFAKKYRETIRRFVEAHQVKSIVDLGCGDFRVAEAIGLDERIRYVGCDIVRDLVDRNTRVFGRSGVVFKCLNIVEDELPDGEVCLIRQVFQHLSNREIMRVLKKCSVYKFVLVTEHLYVGPGSRPNVDKPHGPDTRVPDRSGVFLECAPFGLRTQQLLELQVGDVANGEVLRTTLVSIDRA